MLCNSVQGNTDVSLLAFVMENVFQYGAHLKKIDDFFNRLAAVPRKKWSNPYSPTSVLTRRDPGGSARLC